MTILNTPQHITSLATSAVIVDLRMHLYTGRKTDDAMADKVSSDEGAKQRVMSISHDLFAGNTHLKDIHRYRQRIYNWLQEQTYDWAGNLRLLPTYKLPEFLTDAEEHKKQFSNCVEAFVGQLETIIANAAFARGPLFKREDYPTADELRGKFHIGFSIMEVPQGDFRVQVAQDLADDLRANFEQQAKDYIHGIADSQADKLRKLMTSISYCCELETVTDAEGSVKIKRRRLYDSTIQQAIDLCDDIAKFNIGEYQTLEDVRVELASLLKSINVSALRESEALREKVKGELDSILSKF